jgi:hypothetical protein
MRFEFRFGPCPAAKLLDGYPALLAQTCASARDGIRLVKSNTLADAQLALAWSTRGVRHSTTLMRLVLIFV